jgi:hypothetical protein
MRMKKEIREKKKWKEREVCEEIRTKKDEKERYV